MPFNVNKHKENKHRVLPRYINQIESFDFKLDSIDICLEAAGIRKDGKL